MRVCPPHERLRSQHPAQDMCRDIQMRGSLLFGRLNALLVRNSTGGLAGGLAGRLALAASGVFAGPDAGLLNILNVLHSFILHGTDYPLFRTTLELYTEGAINSSVFLNIRSK